MKQWTETFRDGDIWDNRERRTRTLAGPDSVLGCVSCGRNTVATVWHRAYEREHFRQTGWTTPAMEKELAHEAAGKTKRTDP